jgi:hypothetical protein
LSMNNIMKIRNLMTAAIIAGGAIIVSPSATFGQAVPDDLYMGFQNLANSASKDYIINLGPASSIVGGSLVIDLSGDFLLSDFNSVLGNSSSMYGGVVGASNAGNPSDVYLTQLRSGGAGTPSVAGSNLTTTKASVYGDNFAFTSLGTLVSPSAGTGVLDTTKTWENDVEDQPNTLVTGTFWAQTGINPDSSVSKTSVFYLDLWHTSSSGAAQPYVYQGYFTLDLTGGTPKLTFTPKNAPATLSSPAIASISKAAGTVTVVSSNAVATYNYQLQYTTTLNPASWNNVGSAVIAGATMVTNSDTTATDSQRFYRVQAY